MHLLWTDILFLLMLISLALSLLVSLCRPPSRLAFKRVFKRPIAICSAILLVFFIAIAVLDSIRLQVNRGSESLSLLDQILQPLDRVYEKTYSAPLNLHLFVIETATLNGKVQQIQNRLIYPPKGMQTEQQKTHFILSKFWQSLLQTFLVLAIVVFGYFTLALIRTRRLKLVFSSRSFYALLTLACCCFFMLLSYKLSRQLHVFGTGKIGQDIFYYTIKSIRTGLVIGTLTTVFMLPLALVLGVAAGYFGGVIDDLVQYVYTVLSSIPGVLLITASVLSMQTYIANHPLQFPTLAQSADARLLALCVILGVTSWTSLCRLLRAEALKFREIDFVLAARVLGTSHWRILRKHLLPNMMPLILITVVLDFSFLVLAEAVLSYVGVGVSPMTISWGNMINGARLELARDPVVWWPILAAFVLMFALVLALNLFADEVRNAIDPHQVEHL